MPGFVALILLAGSGLLPDAAFAQEAARTEPDAAERGKLEAAVQAVHGFPPMLVVLAELSRNLPEGYWLDYLSIEGTEVRLRLRGAWDPQFAGMLRQSPWFQDLELRTQGQDLNFIRLELRRCKAAATEAVPDAAKVLIPDGAWATAARWLETQLHEAARRSGLELLHASAGPARDLPEHFERISVRGRANLQSPGLMMLLRELEVLRPRIAVSALTVRVVPDNPDAEQSVMIQVSAVRRTSADYAGISGAVRDPEPGGADGGSEPLLPCPSGPLPDPFELAEQALYSAGHKP
jgi:hypothetical protein